MQGNNVGMDTYIIDRRFRVSIKAKLEVWGKPERNTPSSTMEKLWGGIRRPSPWCSSSIGPILPPQKQTPHKNKTETTPEKKKELLPSSPESRTDLQTVLLDACRRKKNAGKWDWIPRTPHGDGGLSGPKRRWEVGFGEEGFWGFWRRNGSWRWRFLWGFPIYMQAGDSVTDIALLGLTDLQRAPGCILTACRSCNGPRNPSESCSCHGSAGSYRPEPGPRFDFHS